MDPRNAKQAAKELLAQASYDPKKLALLFAGASVIFSLVCALISYLLGIAADNASGLSGLATRTLMHSGQSVISIANTVLLLFWQFGFVAAALDYSRSEEVDHHTLLSGFRSWGPVIRLSILLLIVAMGVIMACSYIANFIFTLSPLSNTLYEKMAAMEKSGQSIAVTDELIAKMLPYMGGLLVIFVLLLIVIGLPVLYRYRMCEFALMDGAGGALASIRESKRLSFGRRMGMFKLDLSFWWYYLLQGLVAAVSYTDVILPYMGVKLPIPAEGLSWILLAVTLGLQFLITWKFSLGYQTAYAVYYNRLKEDAIIPETPRPIMNDVPPNAW